MRAFPVVSALIRQGGKILLARRPPGKKRAGFFEFPGGKVEPGESPEEALFRELREELGVSSQIGPLLAEVEHQYPEVLIRLLCFEAKIQGEPRPLEAQEIVWVRPEEVVSLPLAPADRKLWVKLESKIEF